MVLPRPARGAGTLIPSAQRLVWAAKQLLGCLSFLGWQNNKGKLASGCWCVCLVSPLPPLTYDLPLFKFIEV